MKHTGDGIMVSFPSAVSAVEASLAIQRELEGGEVRVRIGINTGEPITQDDDLFGTAVQLVTRITDRAKPGQVLVSRVVMDLCARKTFEFTSAGDRTLKGFEESVALYQVGAGLWKQMLRGGAELRADSSDISLPCPAKVVPTVHTRGHFTAPAVAGPRWGSAPSVGPGSEFTERLR